MQLYLLPFINVLTHAITLNLLIRILMHLVYLHTNLSPSVQTACVVAMLQLRICSSSSMVMLKSLHFLDDDEDGPAPIVVGTRVVAGHDDEEKSSQPMNINASTAGVEIKKN